MMMGRSSRMARTMRSAASTTPGSDSGSFNWVSLAARKATARPGSSIPRLINNWAVSGEIPAARESDAIRSESNGFSRHRVVIRVGSPASYPRRSRSRNAYWSRSGGDLIMHTSAIDS